MVDSTPVENSAHTLRLVIVTPELTIFDEPSRFVTLPLFDSQRGVAYGHAPFIGRLGAGEVRIIGVDKTIHRYFVEGGFVEVGPSAVSIVAHRAIRSQNLNAVVAREQKEALLKVSAHGDEAIDARQRAVDAARAKVRAATNDHA